MEYLLISFIGGLLTVLTPCVLPILPVVLGGSATDTKNRTKPFVIIGSLVVSIILFSLLLKASTVLIGVDAIVWEIISGGIIFSFGVVTVFPELWTKIEIGLHLNTLTNQALNKSAKKKGLMGDILVGASLGPVFASCSPVYAIIIASLLPVSIRDGIINLIVYGLGLGVSLIIFAVLGQRILSKFKWAVDPKGWFKKSLGVLFILLGILIMTGFIKDLETKLVEKGFGRATNIEMKLINNLNENEMKNEDILNVKVPYTAPELVGIDTWFNTDPLTMEDLRGKVVIIDFWTYSCINCIRTLPYLAEWNMKYADKGLVIIGIHAPEFAFEKVPENLQKAIQTRGLKYPIAMDNNYKTWRAYDNKYWPAKYFIDKDGKVRHTHFGEGEYEESERVIQLLLSEIDADLEGIEINSGEDSTFVRNGQSPETYINYTRGAGLSLVNQSEFNRDETVDYSLQNLLLNNSWTLGGKWKIESENSVAMSDDAKLRYKFSAKDVYLVMGADSDGAKVKVLINGKSANSSNKGQSVDENGYVNITGHDIYHLVSLDEFESGVELELQFDKGVQVNAFTFGGK